MSDHTIDLLFSAETIAQRIDEMAAQLAPTLPEDPILLGLMNGAFIFIADFARALSKQGVSATLDFMTLSSYGAGTETSGRVQVVQDCREDLAGRTVILLDDILDSGYTMAFAKRHLKMNDAAKVISVVLLNKQERRQVDIKANLVGFEVPNLFVVGYGIDYAHRYRDLPYVGTVRFDKDAS
ncbi:MAG: hypoxanthine phosphoribosyltransferase [Magnetococcales bacterium]|nr:hypoxanthine phosphoribosyltransferase [Magnetococcales bacterium]